MREVQWSGCDEYHLMAAWIDSYRRQHRVQRHEDLRLHEDTGDPPPDGKDISQPIRVLRCHRGGVQHSPRVSYGTLIVIFRGLYSLSLRCGCKAGINDYLVDRVFPD